MKVGDYVRTKNGNIRKIVELTNTKYIDEPDYYVDKVLINIEQNKAEDTIYMEKWLFEEEIIKSSPNIIDLIEVGDYVNGVEVIDLADGIHLEFANNVSYVDVGLSTYRDGHVEGIETIVTKEQFSSMEYKVESEVK